MAGPKSSSASQGAAPADSSAAAGLHGGRPVAAVEQDTVATGRRPTPAPALSAYEEELLRAYSPTLAGTYERWKEEGDDMPLVLAVMLRQWRTAGCPVERGGDGSGVCLGDSLSDSSGDSSLCSATDGPHAHSARDHMRDHMCDSSKDSFDSSLDDHVANPHMAELGITGGAPMPAATPATTATARRPTAKSPLLRESTPKAKSDRADKGDKKSDKNAQMTLPGVSVPRTPGETAPMSNYLARTSLFAPIRKGRRVMHDKQMLHSPEGIDVLYTGKQLDMADQDVYLTALRLAGGIKAGDRILINRAAFLRMLGYKHNPGARDYKWLEESFYRISTGRVIIKAKHIEANLPLMGALLTDTRSGDYYFTIPRETYALWAKNLYSYIDLEKRHALERNVPLSKWLQSYAQSHAPGTHTISMDLLHLWCGYGGRLRDFRDSLTGALEELTRVGILTSWAIQERGKGRQKKIMISWVRERTHRDDAPPPMVEE